MTAQGSQLRFLVFVGSVRRNGMAARVGRFVQKLLETRHHSVEVLDPKELNLGEVIQPLHFYSNPRQVPAILHHINEKIKAADGFVVVAAEYNSAISPASSSLMGNFPQSSYVQFFRKTEGKFGGIRAAMQLRQFLSELRTVHVPAMLVVPRVHETILEDGEETTGGYLTRAGDTMCRQLAWYANALKKHRESEDTPD
ncbi:hypothetical protein RvY_11950-2 [Ramazzottius varieornatus]|uniref:NADPH-dependent FMN reductase-like domain-containing protein n=1 Tax=Ramazzottius varieornatus TaxID=947166 RepID=A0A1D1VQI5_RAMVA|nr:hypothetical protein RvY_11950-2 [Ramazzottius varieornatus]